MANTPLLVDASDIVTWSNRLDAKARLPQLVRRLMFATLENAIPAIDVRAGEGVSFGGWDGIIQTIKGNAFVPDGVSVWEFGTDGKIKIKADRDYEKRTANPLGITPAEATYVATTSRRWRNKQKWSQKKREQGLWRDVRAYDADDIETWLELAPSVHLWISSHLGRNPGSAEDLATYWETWSTVTDPPIPSTLVVAGREAGVRAVTNWLAAAPGAIAVQAATSEEAVAFIAASFGTLPAADCERAFARAVVVYDLAAWQRLTAAGQQLLLIPMFGDRSRTPAAVGRGHHIALPLGANEQPLANTTELPRVHRQKAKAVFASTGLPETQAEEHASLARSGLAVLRRRIAIQPTVLVPAWAAPEVGRALVPALLSGRWDDSSPADQSVIAAIAGSPYAEYRKILERWAREADPPIRRTGSVWTLSAKDDAWSLLSRFITDDDLQRFEIQVLQAIGELDPQYELVLAERPYAPIRNLVPRHSRALRSALADTLAVMVAANDVFPLAAASVSGEEVAQRIVSELLRRATTWQAWASLSDQLQPLAEAAPDIFLVAVDRDLSGDRPVLAGLFADESVFLVRSPHSNLLWALEALAWCPTYLSQAALALARLCRIDPHAESVNGSRPRRSLREFFLIWHPSTAARLEQRMEVIDRLREMENEVAWRLMVDALPNAMTIAMSTAKPRRRDWVLDEEPQVTYKELFQATREIVHRMRLDVGMQGSRWKDLIKILNTVPESDYESIVEDLSRLDPNAMRSEDQKIVRDTLRSFLARHREYQDTDWAISSEKLSLLDEVYARFDSTDPIERYRWIFDKGARVPNKKSDEDLSSEIDALEQAQFEAIQDVLHQRGLAAVFALAEQAERPIYVGFALGRVDLDLANEEEVLRHAVGSGVRPLRELGSGFLAGRVRALGIEWLRAVTSRPLWADWNSSQRTDYYLVMPYERTTWIAVAEESVSIQREYWERAPLFGGSSREDHAFVDHELLRLKLFARLIDFLAARSHTTPNLLDVDMVMTALQCAATDGDGINLPTWRELAYDVSRLLDVLEKSSIADDERLGTLEWVYFPLVRHYRPANALHRLLGRDARSYVELLKCACKARNQEATALSPAMQARALSADELLAEWRRPPGMGDNDSLDGATLKKWVSEARSLAAEADRSEIADYKIGELLAGSPRGSDGIWPHEAVRDLVEALRSEELERGIGIGRYNKRGREMREISVLIRRGRELSAEYRRHAGVVNGRWPRTAILLKRMAERYMHEVRHWETGLDLDEDQWGNYRPIRSAPGVVSSESARDLQALPEKGSEEESDE